MITPYLSLLKRDLKIHVRQKGEWVAPVLFLIMIASVFSFSLGRDPVLLQKTAPAILWVGVLLSYLISLEKIFRFDFETGALEQLFMSPFSVSLLIFSKLLAHILAFGLPLILMVPLLSIFLNLPTHVFKILVGSLLLGLPCLTCVGSLCCALTLGLPGGGMLLSFLNLPLIVPILIFGSQSVMFATEGFSVAGHFSILGAFLIMSLLLTPIILAWIVRVSHV